MKLKAIEEIKTQGEAQSIAIEWQAWQSKQSLSYGEMLEFSTYFERLADKFNLVREFKENGVI